MGVSIISDGVRPLEAVPATETVEQATVNAADTYAAAPLSVCDKKYVSLTDILSAATIERLRENNGTIEIGDYLVQEHPLGISISGMGLNDSFILQLNRVPCDGGGEDKFSIDLVSYSKPNAMARFYLEAFASGIVENSAKARLGVTDKDIMLARIDIANETKTNSEMSTVEASASRPVENERPEAFNRSNTRYVDMCEAVVIDKTGDAEQPNLYTDHALPCIIVAVHDGKRYGLAHFTAADNGDSIKDFLGNFDPETANVDIVSGDYSDVKRIVDITRSEHLKIRHMLSDSSRGKDVSDAYLIRPDGTGLYGEIKGLKNN